MNVFDLMNDIDKKTDDLVYTILLTMPAELIECAKDNESFRALITACIAVNISKAFLKKWGKIDFEKNFELKKE